MVNTHLLVFAPRQGVKNNFYSIFVGTIYSIMNFAGLIVGVCTFLIIGFFHPIVIKAEYHWGVKCWWVFLVVGIAATIGSLLIRNMTLSTLLGVFAFSSFWSIKELYEQRERVRKGWFPANPNRKN